MACARFQRKQEVFNQTQNELMEWLNSKGCLPAWSRLSKRNAFGWYRNISKTKIKEYDVEIKDRLWSLWGSLHPNAPVFNEKTRGKQFLACNVLACCAVTLYQLDDWNPKLMDSIVISGDKYYSESTAKIRENDYEISLENLNRACSLQSKSFVVHIEQVAFGKLYTIPTATRMNLARALVYFFSFFQYGILQCNHHSLAFGRTTGQDGSYFMYDCQSSDYPLYPKGQGASYLLRTKYLQVLLYCIVITLNIPYHNVSFTLHKVDILPEGAATVETKCNERLLIIKN